MKKPETKVVDGDEDFEWEQIKADQHSDGRDWDDALRDEYLALAHGVTLPDDVDVAVTTNEIEHARGTASAEDDAELDEILRLAGISRRRLSHRPSS